MSAPASPLQFSVVIPACRRPESLLACLRCLDPGVQTFPASFYEIIVTDDSPDDHIRKLVENNFPAVTWTAGPRLGPAANRNHGAALARGEWIAFTDDDCLPEPHWLAAFATKLDSLLPALPDVLEGCTVADRPRRSLGERSPQNTHGGYLWSCNLAVRAEFFRQLGGFDPGFPFAAMEDVEFATRVRAAGGAEAFAADAKVCHPWREIRGFRAMWTAEKHYWASLQHFLNLHPSFRPDYAPAKLLRHNLRHLLRETAPGLIHWSGRGFFAALAWHLHTLKCACALPAANHPVHSPGRD